MIVIAFWVAPSVAVAVPANRNNRNPGAWLLLALVFSPLVAGAFALAAGPRLAQTIVAVPRLPTPEDDASMPSPTD